MQLIFFCQTSPAVDPLYSYSSGKDIEGYEIEKEYMPQVAKRVNLARKLDKLLHAERKKKTERDWIISNAKAMELAVDDDL